MNSTPHPTRDALYSAILAHPDEDTPRLVFADYEQEYGDRDRAEFIRLQCRLARMNDWDDGHSAADARSRRLLAEHPEWLEPLRPFADFGWHEFSRPPLVRGFPGYTELMADRFLKVHPKLFATVPLQSVSLRCGNVKLCNRLAACGAVARLRDLDIALADRETQLMGSAVRSVRALAAVRDLAGVERLAVEMHELPVAHLEPLVTSPHLRRLRALTLRFPTMFGTADAIRAAARWKWPPALRELTLDNCILEEGLLARLLRARWLTRLERLSVEAEHDDSGRCVFEALGGGRLASLVDLAVDHAFSYPEVLGPVLKLDAPRLQSLRLPNLHPAMFFAPKDDPTSGLFRAGFLRELRRLELGMANLPDAWLVAAADAPFAQTLRVLDVGSSRFTPAGFRAAFGPKRRWPELQRLNVWHADCPEDVLARLVDHDGLPRLVSLRAGAPAGPEVPGAAGEVARVRPLPRTGPQRPDGRRGRGRAVEVAAPGER